MWVKSFLSSQYVLLLTQVSSFDFLWRQEKKDSILWKIVECWNFRAKSSSLSHNFLGDKSGYLGYLKNLGWCVTLFSSRTLRLSLCISSILCFCSSAASRFPSSSSLPARHRRIHYANIVKHFSSIFKFNHHSCFFKFYFASLQWDDLIMDKQKNKLLKILKEERQCNFSHWWQSASSVCGTLWQQCSVHKLLNLFQNLHEN